ETADLEISGMLLPSERRVFLNAAESPQRRRFTLAHELGHWICQCLDGAAAPVYCREQDVGLDPVAKALEREANVFAAELLMPEDAVRAGLELGVSGEALAWRRYSFGLGPKPKV